MIVLLIAKIVRGRIKKVARIRMKCTFESKFPFVVREYVQGNDVLNVESLARQDAVIAQSTRSGVESQSLLCRENLRHTEKSFKQLFPFPCEYYCRIRPIDLQRKTLTA